MPEFTADELFVDLPYMVFGEFAGFIIARIHEYGIGDPVVKRSFEFVNALFFEGDRETLNLIETTLFEELADDRRIATAAAALLDDAPREAFARIASLVGPTQ